MFVIHTIDDDRIPGLEYLPAAAITPKIGVALKQSSGQLAVCSGTTKPDYICMTERAAAVAAGTLIPVIRVNEDTVFETEFFWNVCMSLRCRVGNQRFYAAETFGIFYEVHFLKYRQSFFN